MADGGEKSTDVKLLQQALTKVAGTLFLQSNFSLKNKDIFNPEKENDRIFIQEYAQLLSKETDYENINKYIRLLEARLLQFDFDDFSKERAIIEEKRKQLLEHNDSNLKIYVKIPPYRKVDKQKEEKIKEEKNDMYTKYNRSYNAQTSSKYELTLIVKKDNNEEKSFSKKVEAPLKVCFEDDNFNLFKDTENNLFRENEEKKVQVTWPILYSKKVLPDILKQNDEYKITRILNPEISQEDNFKDISIFVNSLCERNEHDVLIMAYGQSNSGKTYTMQGDMNNMSNEKEWGIVPRVVDKLCKTNKDGVDVSIVQVNWRKYVDTSDRQKVKNGSSFTMIEYFDDLFDVEGKEKYEEKDFLKKKCKEGRRLLKRDK